MRLPEGVLRLAMDIDLVLQKELTAAQYAAAMDGAREVLCLACAGSGKSRTLAYRIARLLAAGEPPASIVAFTFTEKAAESIKRRVAQALTAAEMEPTVLGAMYIGTIHAYCQRILGVADAKYRQYDMLDENRLKLYLMSNYGLLGIHHVRDRKGGGYFNAVGAVADAWKTANDELLDFDAVAAADGDGDGDGDDDPNIGKLLRSISERMEQDEFIDFSLMIRRTVELLRGDSAMLSTAVGALRHLMVDEYQDVNPCQEALIRLLHQQSDTLFVVGDDDQAIYAWRGADVANIIEFPGRYPGCAVHTLSQNFRSATPIVEASDDFVQAELGASRTVKQPVAYHNPTPQDVRVLRFADRPAEAKWVAGRIGDLLGMAYADSADGAVRGLTPADFAVLMRSTRTKEQDGSPRHAAFTAALTAAGIPYSLESGGGAFDRPQVAVLRDTFALLRNESPNRNTARQHFDEKVLPAYPDADFNALTRVFTEWGRLLHPAAGAGNARLYPQRLVYDLLAAFRPQRSGFDDTVWRDLGRFSRMILDVETVYPHIGADYDFGSMLNFLQNPAERGYDVSTDDLLQRPDAVTVSTVHKAKGLEFPVVFVVDAQQGRFPRNAGSFSGWLPGAVMAPALARGAYHSTRDEESRLFYTAVTRAERYLYVTSAEWLPKGKRSSAQSPYASRLAEHPAALDAPDGLPAGLERAAPRQRSDDAAYPTNFSEIKYYLDCPKSYQFSRRYGFNPVIQEMFGYGKSVHTSIQKLHEIYPDRRPTVGQIEPVVSGTFHLKHVAQSRDPENNPGPYERAKDSAVRVAQNYVDSHGSDFERHRATEVVFEIPAQGCVISGAIDLLLKEDAGGNILAAEIIDFKTMDSGAPDDDALVIDWTELALQVQLYARAATQVLAENARTGSVHFLKDNRRVNIPVTAAALDAAIANIEWAVEGILAGDFPMRPHEAKCSGCDFQAICARTPQEFGTLTGPPPPLHLPDNDTATARAFSQYQPARH